MQLDPEHFRKHYASLSDEALLELDRSELVEAAPRCYDAELSRRRIAAPQDPPKGSAEVSFRVTDDEDHRLTKLIRVRH